MGDTAGGAVGAAAGGATGAAGGGAVGATGGAGGGEALRPPRFWGLNFPQKEQNTTPGWRLLPHPLQFMCRSFEETAVDLRQGQDDLPALCEFQVSLSSHSSPSRKREDVF